MRVVSVGSIAWISVGKFMAELAVKDRRSTPAQSYSLMVAVGTTSQSTQPNRKETLLTGFENRITSGTPPLLKISVSLDAFSSTFGAECGDLAIVIVGAERKRVEGFT